MRSFRSLLPALVLVGLFCAARESAATSYVALPDSQLISRSPLIVRARVLDARAVDGGGGLVNTEYRVAVLEVLRGEGERELTVTVPGGELGDRGWWVPGAPKLQEGEETILFLGPWGEGKLVLTELGLSKFDILEDPNGNRFAARAMFLGGESPVVAGEDGERVEVGEALRPLDQFLDLIRGRSPRASLAALGARAAVQPAGPLRAIPGNPDPLWVEIGPLVRWTWDQGAATTTVRYQPAAGQANLSDGTNGIARMTNGIGAWSAVSGTDIRLTAPSLGTGGTIQVTLDDLTGGSPPFSSPCWTTALCGAGVVGCAGPSYSLPTQPFDGRQYYPAAAGYLFMRKYSCSMSADVFENSLSHEFGHILGLGHSDEAISAKDPDQVQFSLNHCLATMRSCIGNCGGPCGSTNNLRVPFALGDDDRTAVRYTYPSSGPLPAPTVTSVLPTQGSTAGGTPVAIGGTGFVAPATVLFGGTAATGVTVSSSASITATTPAHVAGAVAVAVRNPDTQTGTLADAFTYVVSPMSLTALSPRTGPAGGGTVVTLTGSGFLAGANVTVGGAAASSITVSSATTITAATPVRPIGPANVVVTNPGGATATIPGGFLYTATGAAARLSSVTPCRLVDTRNATGPFGGPALAVGEVRSFTVATGACGIPADAVGVSLNVTVADATAAGTLTFFPGIGTVPGTNTISFVPAKNRANNVTMGLVGGVLSVRNYQTTGTVNLIVDVNGYYR